MQERGVLERHKKLKGTGTKTPTIAKRKKVQQCRQCIVYKKKLADLEAKLQSKDLTIREIIDSSSKVYARADELTITLCKITALVRRARVGEFAFSPH